MEALKRLADEIAAAYLRNLKQTTGNDIFSYNGKTGKIYPCELSSGLVDNAISLAHQRGYSGLQMAVMAHHYLRPLITFNAQIPLITSGGIDVIEHMNCSALRDNQFINLRNNM